MQLIEVIEQLETDTIRCLSVGHTSAAYPLRINGVLYTAALLELGAQAAAAHASIHGMGGAHAGLVLAANNVKTSCTRVNAERLMIEADLLESMDGAARYRFTVSDASPLIEGVLLLTMRDREE